MGEGSGNGHRLFSCLYSTYFRVMGDTRYLIPSSPWYYSDGVGGSELHVKCKMPSPCFLHTVVDVDFCIRKKKNDHRPVDG